MLHLINNSSSMYLNNILCTMNGLTAASIHFFSSLLLYCYYVCLLGKDMGNTYLALCSFNQENLLLTSTS